MKYNTPKFRAYCATALLFSLLFASTASLAAAFDKKVRPVAASTQKAKPADKAKPTAKPTPNTAQKEKNAPKTKAVTPALVAKNAPVARKTVAAKPAASRITLSDKTLRAQSQKAIERDNLANEDPYVRQAALEALGQHAGTVVVMNPKTGQVYAIVNQEWGVRTAFKPCSTIKIVTGLAGLSEGLIDPLRAMDVIDRNEMLNLGQALAISNNGYFQTIGSELGFEKMLDYALRLGLGRRTGINLSGESAGRIPVKVPAYGVGRMSSHGDDFAVTPLQLAVLISAVANNGAIVQPHIGLGPRRVSYRVDNNSVRVPLWSWQQVLPGLKGAVKYGTAKRAFDADNRIAGKTGSCIGQGSWLGLFTSYAPVADPQVAVVVVTRGLGERGKYAAAVAGKVHQAIKGHFAYQRDEWAAGREELPTRPRNNAHSLARPTNSDDDSDAGEFDETDDQSPSESVNGGATRARRTRP